MQLHRTAFGLVALLGVAIAPPGPAAADKIMVTNYARVTNTLNWVIAFKKNFFKDEGLDVDEIVRGDGGGTSLRKMLAGELPYGEVTIMAALAAIRQGVPLVIVNAANNHPTETSLVMAKGRDFKSIKDLAGKKVGYSNPKSLTELLFKVILHRNGMLDKVELVALGSLGPTLTALDTGSVDAGPMVDPYLSLQPDKFRIIFRISDHIPRVTWGVGVTTKEFAAKNPDKLRAFIRVHRRSAEYIYANPKEAADIFAETWQRPRDEVEKFLPKYFTDMPGLWSKGDFDKEGLEVINQGLKLIGDIDKPIDWNSVIDQRFLPEDLQRKL